MKNLNVLLVAAIGAFAFSCSNGEAEEALEQVENEVKEIVEATTYSVDTEASQLNWKGTKKIASDDGHAGFVKFSEGSATVEGETLKSGAFTVDMSTIATTDELPEDKKEYLVGHLSNEDFFHVEEYPTVTVATGEITDGNMPTTITVMGTEIQQDIPVEVLMDGDKMTVTGSFDVDFEELGRAGFAENEEGERIMPVIAYNLNLVLTK